MQDWKARKVREAQADEEESEEADTAAGAATAKRLDQARDDLRKSGRTFSSVEEIETLLEHHLTRIGPASRALQATMFPGKPPTATGGFGSRVTIRPPRSKTDERLAQLLKHISQLVFASIRGLTQEVEALYVNGVLVIAGNEERASAKLLELANTAAAAAGLAPPASMLQQLVDLAVRSDRRKVDQRLSTAAAKMAGLVERTRGEPGDGAPAAADGYEDEGFAGLAALVREAHIPAKIYTASEAQAAIETGTPSVLFMHDSDIHAEQQLVRVLVRSRVRGLSATIRGTKRACLGCYLALTYAERFQGATGLNHGVRPGGFWLNSCQSALEFMMEHPGTKTSQEAADWAFAEANRVERARVNRTRKLTADEGRSTPGVAAVTADTRAGDADADTDTDTDGDEESLSSEMRRLVRQLAKKPPPKKHTTSKKALAAATPAGDADDGDDPGPASGAGGATSSRAGRSKAPRGRGAAKSPRSKAPSRKASGSGGGGRTAASASRKRKAGDEENDADTSAATPGSLTATPASGPQASAARARLPAAGPPGMLSGGSLFPPAAPSRPAGPFMVGAGTPTPPLPRFTPTPSATTPTAATPAAATGRGADGSPAKKRSRKGSKTRGGGH
jgi:hypothetical protein